MLTAWTGRGASRGSSFKTRNKTPHFRAMFKPRFGGVFFDRSIGGGLLCAPDD
jgi:hypothetical protein